MIRLYQFPTFWGVPNLSPFCMKVETWLKLAGLPYEVVWTPAPRGAPLGKLPVVRDGDRAIPDSHTILEELGRAHGVSLDAGLSAEQRAIAHAFTRLCSEHLYWAIVHTRWGDAAGWSAIRPKFFGFLPGPVRWVAEPLVRRGNLKQLYGHGLGRHPAEEIFRRGVQDLEAIADFLGTKPFMFGEQPASVDATIYAFVANVVDVPIEGPLKRAAAARANLVQYCRRMKARCFPEPKAA